MAPPDEDSVLLQLSIEGPGVMFDDGTEMRGLVTWLRVRVARHAAHGWQWADFDALRERAAADLERAFGAEGLPKAYEFLLKFAARVIETGRVALDPPIRETFRWTDP